MDIPYVLSSITVTIKIIGPTPREAQWNIPTAVLEICIKISNSKRRKENIILQLKFKWFYVLYTLIICVCLCKQTKKIPIPCLTGFWNRVHEGKNETILLILSFNFSKYRSTALEKKKVERNLDFVFSPLRSSKRQASD